MQEYNSETNMKMKVQIGRSSAAKWGNVVFSIFMVAVVVSVMILFEEAELGGVWEVSDGAAVGGLISDFLEPKSCVYAVIIEILGGIYEKCATRLVEWHNYRYRKDFDDHLAIQLFIFQCINYYVPLGFVAFHKQKFNSLFSILVTLLVVEQATSNLHRYFTAVCCYKGKI